MNDVDEGVVDAMSTRYEAEIERLRAALWSDEEVEHEITLCRNQTIEECARRVEHEIRGPDYDNDTRLIRHIADAIRALKSDTGG